METCKECQKKGTCLSKINLFNKLDVDESKSIYISAIHKHIKKGESIFLSNDPIDKIIVLRYGKIKSSSYDEDGRESIRKIYLEGDIIGEDSIFLDNNYSSNGVAIEDTGICQIDKNLLRNILVKDHDFSLNMIKSLSEKLFDTERLLEILSIKNSYRRLAAFLLYRAKMSKDNFVSLNQENIASSINMTRETVSRKLSELENDGYIENIAYKKIRIKNISALENLTNM